MVQRRLPLFRRTRPHTFFGDVRIYLRRLSYRHTYFRNDSSKLGGTASLKTPSNCSFRKAEAPFLLVRRCEFEPAENKGLSSVLGLSSWE